MSTEPGDTPIHADHFPITDPLSSGGLLPYDCDNVTKTANGVSYARLVGMGLCQAELPS